MAIEAVGGALASPVVPAAKPATPPGEERNGTAFVDSLGRLVAAVDAAGSDANVAVAGMLDGSADVHDAMIALQRAELTLQLTVQVRNKLVQAYQEIMRMPI